ncbi:hypothetical protein [Nocardia sp. NPDC047654]|uniref:hypothetical protein n=1 Tax=Nocardia sp. NPDC047654 TaxID=3364314 RepID=UPI0037163A83
MQREREDQMRVDFAEYIGVLRQMTGASITDPEQRTRFARTAQLADPWRGGRDGGHWEYLEDAYARAERDPQSTTRILAGIERAESLGFEPFLTDMQLRSLRQVRDLTGHSRPERASDNPAPRHDRGSGIERSR